MKYGAPYGNRTRVSAVKEADVSVAGGGHDRSAQGTNLANKDRRDRES